MRRTEADAARGGDRLPRRDLQVQLGDPELAARRPQRAPLLHRQHHHQGAAVVAVRGHQRGPQRRGPGRAVRPLPGPRAVRQPRQLPLPRPARSGHQGRGGPRPAAPTSAIAPLVSLAEVRRVHERMDDAAAVPRGVPGPLQGPALPDPVRGGRVSDRRAVKLLKLFAASALLDGRDAVNDARLLRAQAHLEQRRPGAAAAGHRRPGAGTPPPRAPRASAGWAAAGVDLDAVLAELGMHPRAAAGRARRCPTCSCSRSCATCRTSGRRCRRWAPRPPARWWPRSTSCSRASSSRRGGPVDRPASARWLPSAAAAAAPAARFLHHGRPGRDARGCRPRRAALARAVQSTPRWSGR